MLPLTLTTEGLISIFLISILVACNKHIKMAILNSFLRTLTLMGVKLCKIKKIKKKYKIYIIYPKFVQHQSDYCCVNIHICYNDRAYLHSYCKCVYYYFINFFSHMCSHKSSSPTYSPQFLSPFPQPLQHEEEDENLITNNHQHHLTTTSTIAIQHYQPSPPQPTSTVENPNTKSIQPSKINLKLNSK